MIMTSREMADLMPDFTQLESNEPEMESSLHYAQLALLVACLEWLWQDRTDFFIGANLTIYFSRQQLKNHDFRGPDFFLVKNTKKHPRKSWVTWEEGGQYPDIIIELLSDSTAKVDRTLKKELYQDRFRTPEYFWFSPETLELQGYRLTSQVYEEIAARRVWLSMERSPRTVHRGSRWPTPLLLSRQKIGSYDGRGNSSGYSGNQGYRSQD